MLSTPGGGLFGSQLRCNTKVLGSICYGNNIQSCHSIHHLPITLNAYAKSTIAAFFGLLFFPLLHASLLHTLDR